MNSSRIEPRTLKGFRDLLPAEALIKSRMLSTAVEVFQSFGFAPIETPHLEYTDILIGESGEEIGKQLYRFEDQGGRDVCLRFDLTVPFARYVVQHKNDLGIPFKRYAIGSAFRGEQPQFGRFREFTQCDFDFVGTDSLGSDAEIIQVISALLNALGIENFTIRVNNRRIMNGLAESLGVEERASDILRVIDKWDKVGREKVKELLLGEASLSEEQANSLIDFVSFSSEGQPSDFFAKAKSIDGGNETLSKGLSELEELSSILSAMDVPFKVDFTIARGLGYYTGIVYETMLDDLPDIGSVCSGGRYDNLTMNFSKDRLPGVGASVGIDRLITAMVKLGLVEGKATPSKVLVTLMEEKDCAYVHGVAAALRRGGISVEVYPQAAKLKKQFQYADKRGHAYVAVIGADEIAEGAITLKDMASGKQATYASAEEAIEILS